MSVTLADPGVLLPHGPGMRFLSRICAFEDEMLECEVVPGERDHAFVRDGKIPISMSIEYMAQAIGAFVSLNTGEGQGRPGYVIAVRRLVFSAPGFELHRPLLVRVDRRWGEVAIARFDARILGGNEQLAGASLSVFRPSEENE